MSLDRWRPLFVRLAWTVPVVGVVVGVWRLVHNSELLLVLLSVVIPWALPPLPKLDPSSDQRGLLAASAERVGRFWEDEAKRRRENDVDVNMTPSRWRRSGAVRWARDYLPVEGDSNELIRRYVERPFRLLLLGEPGSGKTAFCVQLTRALLRDNAMSRLPVLLVLASWNRSDDIDTWIVEQLRTVHGIGRRQARELLESHQLLPILDGLDEGEGVESSLADTVGKLNASRLIGDRPFVLTCRAHAFDAAAVDHLVGRDAEIRIQPLTTVEIVQVLTEAFGDRPGWEPVIDELRRKPGGPLAQALNTRLMLFLMIRVFSQPGPPPGDLLDNPDLSTADSIRDYLVGRFLDGALPEAPGHRFTNPRQNTTWLRYLAGRLGGRPDGRLSWWRFFEVLRGSKAFVAVRMVVGALITACLCVILFGLFGHPLIGLVFGAILGGAGAAAMRVPDSPAPAALPRALRSEEGPWPSISSGLIAGLGGAAAIGFLYRDALIGVTVGTAIGIGIGMGRHLLTRAGPESPALSPRAVLRDDRRSVVNGLLLGGVLIGFVGAGLGLVGRARSLGLIVRITSRPQEVALIAAVAALCGAFTLAMTMQATSAWGRFVLTKTILAFRGDTPWRLMTFLEDAERVGILRRLGPQYEFRSEVFFAHLTARAEPPAVEEAAGAEN